MAGILVDTDVLADHLRGRRRFVPGDDEVYVSSITRSELLAGRHVSEAPVARLLGPMAEVPVDNATAARAGRIRREVDVSLADALIAASAIEHDLTLVTYNLFGFRDIDGLRAMAPPSR